MLRPFLLPGSEKYIPKLSHGLLFVGAMILIGLCFFWLVPKIEWSNTGRYVTVVAPRDSRVQIDGKEIKPEPVGSIQFPKTDEAFVGMTSFGVRALSVRLPDGQVFEHSLNVEDVNRRLIVRINPTAQNPVDVRDVKLMDKIKFR